MTLLELMQTASRGYPDGEMDFFFHPETGKVMIDAEGDDLAEFLVIEIWETFNPKASDEEQLEEALRVISNARGDVTGVEQALLEELGRRTKGVAQLANTSDLPLPQRCSTPGCGCDSSLTLHSRCHPDTPTWSVLTGDVLTISCAACDKVVVRLRVTGRVRELSDGQI